MTKKRNCYHYLLIIILLITLCSQLSGCGILPAEEEMLTPPLVQPKRTEYELYQQAENLNNIKIGMKVKVTINGSEYKGEVIMSPDNAPLDALEKYKNAVVVKVLDLPDSAAWGDSIDFSIDIQSKKNVLVIPKKGLRRMMGRSYVQVMDGDSKKEFDVEVGIESAYDVEIRGGLKEGQMVILN